MAYVPRSTDDDAAHLLALAHEALAQGNLGAACEHLDHAFAIRPRDQKIQSLLGMVCFKLGHLERAAELYELLVRENPIEPTLRVNLGLVYLKLPNLPLAIRELQASVDLAPEHKKAHNYLGLALAQAGEYAAAREAFIAAGSVAMVEKMDRALADEGRPVHARGGFPEIDPRDVGSHAAELGPPPPPLPVRPTTARMGLGQRPATLELGGDLRRQATPVALGELAPTWALDAAPAEAFEVRGEVTAIRVAGEVLTRLHPLVALSGAVSVQPEMKRFRGRATDKTFGEGVRRFVRAVGEGFILVATARRVFASVELGDGAGYFAEDAVFAFEEALTFENGRLPGKGAPDLHLVHLRGRGKVLLCTPGPVRSLEVGPEQPSQVAVEHLVGWVGALTPKLLAPLPDADGEAAKRVVELSGEGFALLTLAEQTAAHGREG